MTHINIGNYDLEVVKTFIYLVSKVASSSNISVEVKDSLGEVKDSLFCLVGGYSVYELKSPPPNPEN